MVVNERVIRRINGIEVSQRRVNPQSTAEDTPQKPFNPEGLPVKHVAFEDMYPKLATLYNRIPDTWEEAPNAPSHPTEAAEIIIARKAKQSR